MRIAAPFAGIEAWIFDLDNTLYPTGATIYERIGARMTAYVARATGLDPAAALELQENYYHRYGATLAGLIQHHGVDGRDFLDDVHDVDLDCVPPDPDLAGLIARLPGRRIVFTNGARDYAERMTARLGMREMFDLHFDIEAAGFAPKPERAAFERLIAHARLDPRRCVFFEDSPRNLETAHALGFHTVLVHETGATPDPAPAHIHHAADCLKTFLRRQVLTAPPSHETAA